MAADAVQLNPAIGSNLRFSSRRFSNRPHARHFNRGARIRTGDLCDPNAALYRTEPRPGPTVRQTDSGVGVLLFNTTVPGIRPRGAKRRAGPRTREARRRSTHAWSRCNASAPVGENPTQKPLSINQQIRTGWDSNPRGRSPHDFQSCALSHSATRPRTMRRELHDDTPINGAITEGVGFEPTRCCHQRLSRAPP